MNSTYQTTKPAKEQVRAWMVERQTANTPPPAREQIRRELGWGLIVKSGAR